MSTKQWANSGDLIFREGEPGDHMYIITKGTVRIEKRSINGPIVLARLTSGAFFGEMVLMGVTHRTASAVADTETNLLVFDKNDLSALVRDKPEMAERIIYSLVKRLKTTTDALADAREKVPREDNQRRF